MIETIELRNFRGHVMTSVPCAPFTLLVGENASGKTSVLHAVRYASEGLADSLPGLWAHRGSDEMRVVLAWASEEGPVRVEATYERSAGSDGELRRVQADVRNENGSIGRRPRAHWLTLRAEGRPHAKSALVGNERAGDATFASHSNRRPKRPPSSSSVNCIATRCESKSKSGRNAARGTTSSFIVTIY